MTSILVNKLLFGARIYTNFKFQEGSSLESVRVKGFRPVKPGDVLVFNAPYGYDNEKIAYNINRVLVKRCIGIPGDTMSVVNGFLQNNHSDFLGSLYHQKQFSLLKDDDPHFFTLMEQLPALSRNIGKFEYIFKNNYYFACGDNVENSVDSRSWGFIPEEFIIGIVTTITYSVNPTTKRKRSRRWLRLITVPFYE